MSLKFEIDVQHCSFAGKRTCRLERGMCCRLWGKIMQHLEGRVFLKRKRTKVNSILRNLVVKLEKHFAE